MISPEQMIDNKKLAKMFNDGMDKIRVSMRMSSSEGLYLMGVIFETVLKMYSEQTKRSDEK